MADRYRHNYPTKRSSTFNPARASLPNGIGYNSSYADDSYLLPSSSRHPTTTPRGHITSTTSSGVPTTTRTYAVSQDQRSRSGVREGSSTRRSTLDSATRPPVIVTTAQNDRGRGSYPPAADARNGSPVRGEYRAGDSSYYALPANSHRSRSSTRRYFDENQGRHRERNGTHLTARDADAYRSTRPSVTYPSEPRHSTAAIDYGDEGYKYTNAGELVRYDLDQTQPPRSRRHDSFDRGYYRPKLAYPGNSRRPEASRYDGDRGYIVHPSRHTGSRGGPPPTSRGLDRINRAYEVGRERELPPTAPKPPVPVSSSQAEVGGATSDVRRSKYERPASLGQEPAYHDSQYRRGDDDAQRIREIQDHGKGAEDSRRFQPAFYDDGVHHRGFGIRPGVANTAEDRRDWQREPRKGEAKAQQEQRGSSSFGGGSERTSLQRGLADDNVMSAGNTRSSFTSDSNHGYIREAAATGLGISAAATDSKQPLASPDGEPVCQERDGEVLNPRDDESEWRENAVEEQAVRKKRTDDNQEKRHPVSGFGSGAIGSEVDDFRPGGGVNGVPNVNDTGVSISGSDERHRGRTPRRQDHSNSFDPNDTGDLKQIKEQLAAMRMSTDELHGQESVAEPMQPSRSASPREDRLMDESRGSETGFSALAHRQVRVVSPPREKRDDRPIRGILKQPSASFPEEDNPVREGVAPHREDRKLKEVPPGARWTKINRKIVNPEALSIGKERFEVRDDFVIVLRVLSKEEIQAYATATQVLRERRRTREEVDRDTTAHENSRDSGGGEDAEGANIQRPHRRHGDGDVREDAVYRERDRDRYSEKSKRGAQDDAGLRGGRAVETNHDR